MADGVAVALLGPVRMRASDGDEITLRGHAARLLAWLALADRAWPVDDLADRLWPDGRPATARTVIQGVVSRLRRSLPDDGPVQIETVPGGYRLRSVGRDGVTSPIDVRRFRALAERAPADDEGGDARAAARTLTEALALWRGEALSGVRDDPALDREARALDDERRSAQTALAEALIAGDDIDRALALLGRLVNDDPLDERRWALLMTALTRAGRQTEALRAYRRAVAVLAERTGLEPGPELRRLETAILVQDPSLDGPRWRPATGAVATPIAAIVGRDDERAAVAGRLATGRLVTLVGPGGVGKTTLAVDVATTLAPPPPDGVVVVDLAACRPDGVGAAVAAALGATAEPEVDPVARSAELLARRAVLLVLDGCEHVQTAAAETAAALLRAAARVRILATSQVALGVAGEVVVPVAPLAPPDDGADDATIRSSPAAALLVRRLDDLGIAVADDDWPSVAAIVRALDGLPLAIEVAAAAARTQPLDGLARLLAADTSSVLAAEPLPGSGSRLPLGAALDAACARLDPDAARLYAVLSVFPASFDAEGAAVAADVDEGTSTVALAQLADASLVVLDSTARHRARLLQPVRAHAAARLDDADRAAIEARITGWALALAVELDRTGRSADQAAAIERFVSELPTLRAVLRMLVDAGDIARAAVLFTDLVPCWVDSPAHSEALTWADELLTHADRLDAGPRARLEVAAVHAQYAFELIAAKLDVAEKALRRADDVGDAFALAAAQVQVAIGLGWRSIDLDRAGELVDASRASMLAQGEAYWAALVLEIRGLLALRRLDVATGIATLEEAAAEHRAHGAPADVGHALTFIGFARRAIGDVAGARRAFDEAARVLGPVRVGTWLRATVGSGHASLALGELDLAAATFRAAHDRAVEVGDLRIVGTALVGLAATARGAGELERGVALLEAATDAALAGGDPTDAVTAAGMLGELLVEVGDHDEAAVLLGATDLVHDEVGVRVDFGLALDLGPLREALDEHIGADRMADLARDGRVIGLRPAVRRAVERLLPDATSPPG